MIHAILILASVSSARQKFGVPSFSGVSIEAFFGHLTMYHGVAQVGVPHGVGYCTHHEKDVFWSRFHRL